ncbi:EthD domain-containing protein [Pseudoxanthomonas sp.]|uniref:EthD domain-containing protein n=1 Tax=Pseudoxanthomonas sp. TaxID=1871049 RepID=UPI00262A28CF|nr:EthD domain-containing protein [Pseudoxanthomonas sp.]WDS35499.1 MAG: EthD domain-containing protein [Pseudoxanthomonas sp.]
MLKLNMWIRRRDGLDVAQFQRYWRDHHGPLVRGYSALLGIRRYVQTVPLAQPGPQQALRDSRGALPADFDGCAELWWDDMESHLAARLTREGAAALQALVEDEARFVDLSRSLLWYGSEYEVIA